MLETRFLLFTRKLTLEKTILIVIAVRKTKWSSNKNLGSDPKMVPKMGHCAKRCVRGLSRANKKMSYQILTNQQRPIDDFNRVRLVLTGKNHRSLIRRLLEHLRAAGVVRHFSYTPWNQQPADESFVYLNMVSREHVSGMIRLSRSFKNVFFLF
jgi:hypothetical protein